MHHGPCTSHNHPPSPSSIQHPASRIPASSIDPSSIHHQSSSMIIHQSSSIIHHHPASIIIHDHPSSIIHHLSTMQQASFHHHPMDHAPWTMDQPQSSTITQEHPASSIQDSSIQHRPMIHPPPMIIHDHPSIIIEHP